MKAIDVKIAIRDRQLVNGETEEMSVVTLGTMQKENNSVILKFTEQFDVDSVCSTVLSVTDGKKVTMERSGLYNSELIIEEKVRHNCLYGTPYGEFMIGIYTDNVDFVTNNDGSYSLDMKYTIDFYSGLAAENNMSLMIIPVA